MINLNFVKHRKNYSDEKISALLGIMHFTLNHSLKFNLSQREALQIFKTLLRIHSIPRPPDSIGLFDRKDFIDLEDFFMKTLYRHYPLYETAIKQKAELSLKTLNIVTVDKQQNLSIENDMQEITDLKELPILLSVLEQIEPKKDDKIDLAPPVEIIQKIEDKKEPELKIEEKKEEKKEDQKPKKEEKTKK